MANYATLKAAIQNVVKTNGNNEITGALLQQTLFAMVNSFGAGFQFIGIATPTTNPGTPDQNVFYLAGPGTYPNFGGLTIQDDNLGVLKYNGQWSVETISGIGGGGATLGNYVAVSSVSELPDPGEATIGYLVGENLYLYVGTGGDTLGGKYRYCGPFRGPAGPQGENAIGFEDVATPEDGTIIITLSDGNTITIDINHDHPDYYSKVAETNNPSGGFLPDVVYSLGTLTGSVTFALAAAVTGNVNHYFFMFSTGGTAPTITWPTGITWAVGSAPTVAANKKYEISILNGVAYYSEV